MTRQTLKEIYKNAIRSDFELQHKILKASKGHKGKPVSYRTLERWLLTDSDKLTTATALQVIKDYLNLDKSEELTEAKEDITEVV